MNDENSFTLESFFKSNSPKKINSMDYIHAIFKLNNLPIDFIFCMTKFVYPEFKIVDKLVFLAEQFDLDVYKQYLLEGRGEKECQKWLNLIELTGLFDGVDVEKAIELAELVVKAWNFKLIHETAGAGVARIIFDKETEEVFVTID